VSLGEAEKVSGDVSDCVRQVMEIASALAAGKNSFSDETCNLREVEAELEKIIRQADGDDSVQKMKELEPGTMSLVDDILGFFTKL